MAALKWLLSFLLNWAFDKIKGLIEAYLKRKKVEKEREESNKQAEEKLEKAETEEEVIGAGSDLLKR